jgi:hypothetical protein
MVRQCQEEQSEHRAEAKQAGGVARQHQSSLASTPQDQEPRRGAIAALK